MNARTYVIPIRFLNLAINDEVAGMEESDFELWDWFLLRNGIKYQRGNWSYDEQEPYFCWSNDLNEIGGSVVEVQWVEMAAEE